VKTISLPADTEHLYLDEVAHLIADALWPNSDERYKSALDYLKPELEQAAKDGFLRTRHPVTLRLISPDAQPSAPLDTLLNPDYTVPLHLRVVTVPDFTAYVASRGLNVRMERLNKGGANWDLWADMEQAKLWEAVALSLDIEPDSLPGLDFRPIVGGPFDDCPDEFKRRLKLAVSKFNGANTEIRLSSLREWAAQLTRPWTFPAEFPRNHELPPEPAAINTTPDATEPPEQTQPQPLTTNEIAQLFDGIPFTQERWVKNIGQTKWLGSANRGKGEQGGAPATWCPLTIAQLVYDHEKDTRAKQKTLKNLNSRFRTNPMLNPWKDAWDDYYGMFTEPGEAQ
jgi:hypothetical protein